MKKKRGVLTMALLALLIPIMAFFLVLFDILRLSQARQKIELTSNKALEASLVEYDEGIYKKYRLMSIRDEDKARAAFLKALNFTNSEKGGRPAFLNYKITKSSLRLGAPLSDRKAIKTAILKKHEKYFVVNSLDKWIKKLEELRKLKPYAKACEAYSEGLGEILKLKKDYDKLGEIYKEIEGYEAEIGPLDIGLTIREILDTEAEVEKLEEELRELNSELTGLNSTLSKGRDGDKKPGHIHSKLAEIKTQLDIEEENLKELRLSLDKLKKRNKELNLYYKELQSFHSKLKKAEAKIIKKGDEIQAISQEEDVEEVVELITKLIVKVKLAVEELDKLEPELKEAASKSEEQNRNINIALNRKIDYEGDQVITSSSYARLSDKEGLSSLFGSWDQRKGEVEINSMMDLIWLALNGELLPDFSALSNPDFSEAPHLPSRDSEIREKHTVAKLLERYKEDRPSREEFGAKTLEKTAKNSKDLADKNLNFDIKAIFDKLVIADYVVDTFSHYSFRDEDKDEFFSGAEVEYILSGSEDARHNLIMTQLKIFSLRYCLNFVPIALYKADEIDRISLFLSSFTGGLGYPIYRGLVTLAWCSMESLADLKEIDEGRGAVIIKGRGDILTNLGSNEWELKSGKLFDGEPKKLAPKSEREKEDGASDEDREGGKLRMTYEDHLTLFLIIENEDDSLIRIADLIALKEKLDTRKLYTAMEADIGYDVRLIFPGAKTYLKMNTRNQHLHLHRSISSY